MIYFYADGYVHKSAASTTTDITVPTDDMIYFESNEPVEVWSAEE